MRITIKIAVTLLLSLCAVAHADEQASLEKVRQILSLARLDEVETISEQVCTESYQSSYLSPDASVKKIGNYYGFTPESKEWPEIKAQFERSTASYCKILKHEDIAAIYEKHYRQLLNDNDADKWIAFYQTESGQKLANNQKTLIADVARYQYAVSLAQAQKAAPDSVWPSKEANENKHTDRENAFPFILLQYGAIALIVFFIVTWVMMFYKLFIKKEQA